jgi:hypothetical protein
MRQRIASYLVVGFFGVSRLYAADLSGEVGIGAIYTDNIRLVATDTATDTIGVMTTDFVLHEETRRLDADVAADLQYLTYGHEIYANELFGNLTGYGKLALVPGRIDWVLQDNFGQQQITPGTPVTPLNLENINFASTGPDLSVPLGSQLNAQLSGRYSKVSYQLHDLNNDRAAGSIAIVHPLGATSNASLNATTERVSYDNSAANPDYTTRQGYLHYDAQGARSKLDADVGYNDATIMGTKTGGGLLRADVTRTLSASSSVELAAGQNISDTGDLLRQMQGTGNVTLGAAALQRSQDPFTSRYARAAWHFDRHRTGFELALSQFREIHTIEGDLDRTRTELDVSARRELSRALVLSLGAAYARESYKSAITPNDTDLHGTVDLAWRVGRRIEVHAQYSRVDHKSASLFDTYNENRFMLTAGFATDKRAAKLPTNPIY